MGLGQAFGTAAQAYTRKRNIDLENDRADARAGREERAYKERSEERNLRVSKLKAELKEKNDPQAKRLRAQEMQLKQQKMQLTQQSMNNIYGSEQDQRVQNQIANVEKQVAGQKKVVDTDRAFSDHFMTYADGGMPDFVKVNEIIAGDPILSKVQPNTIIQYNPQSSTHSKGLQAHIEQRIGMAGLTGQEGAYQQVAPGVEAEAKNGLFGFDAKTGKVVDIQMIGNMTGSTKRMANHTIGNVAKRTNVASKQAISQIAVAKELSGNVIGITDKDETMTAKKLWNGKDPAQLMVNAEMTGVPVPSALKEMAKANEELASGGGYWDGFNSEEINQGIENIKGEILSGSTDPKLLARYTSAVSTLKDSDQRKQALKAVDVARTNIKTQDIYSRDTVAPAEKNWMEMKEYQNTTDNTKIGDTKKKLLAEEELITGLNGVSGELIDAVGGEGVVSGFGAAQAMGFLGLDADVSSKALAILNDTSTEKARTQLLNTVGINTKLGRIIVKYVKETSGASVTNEEREFLTRIISGAAQGDPEVMLEAMQSFRDVSVEQLGALPDKFGYRISLPATVYKYKSIGKQTDWMSQYKSVMAKKNKKQSVTGTNGQPVTLDTPPEGF